MYWWTISLLYHILQVLKVLENLGMSAYTETFFREGINGELLLELNEGILQREIGINSQEHVAKLMQIIRGEQSVRSYLLR